MATDEASEDENDQDMWESGDLRDAGADRLVGVAFQGPVSLRVLRELTATPADAAQLCRAMPNAIVRVGLAGRPALVARTGYTGEDVGFEIYVHPDDLEGVWRAILEHGAPLGVMAAGLGARDSTRIEAGFPLFGHELEGELGVSLTEAGYGFVVRFHVPFFIGRAAYLDRTSQSQRHVLRLRGQGRKTVRPGHAILDDSGRAVGQVTSFVFTDDEMTFFALACVEGGFRPEPGQTIRGARVAPDRVEGEIDEKQVVELTVATRFTEDEERAGWPNHYGRPEADATCK